MPAIKRIKVNNTTFDLRDANALTAHQDISGKADLASPVFTGTPTAPTAAAGTNTTQLATTAFVQQEITNKAPLASPAFTGTPTAPTAEEGTSTTQIANTAFVQNAIAGLAAPLDEKTYPSYVCTANNANGKYVYFMKITRNDYNAAWRVRFRFEATIPNHPEYGYSSWDADYYGMFSARKSYYFKVNLGANNIVRYMLEAYPVDKTDNEIYIGCFTNSGMHYTEADYARSLKVTLLEVENCSAVLLDDLLWQKDMTAANYTVTYLDFNATGYSETGDDNTTYTPATASADGLMSSTDKVNLDNSVYDSGMLQLTTTKNTVMYYQRVGRVVTVIASQGELAQTQISGFVTIATIPYGFRPQKQLRVRAITGDGDFIISTGGAVLLSSPNGGSYFNEITITYITADDIPS